MQPRIYTYKITFEEVPYWYWGVHKEKKFGELYLGTPVTHRWMWEFYTPKIQILEFFANTDEGWKEALDVEERIIRQDLNNPLCLNEACGGKTSLAIRRQTGIENVEKKRGLFGRTPEQHSADSQKAGLEGGKVVLENQLGMFNPDYYKSDKYYEDRRRGGGSNVINGTGFLNPEYLESDKRKELHRRLGSARGAENVANKTGFCAPGVSRLGGLAVSEKHRENGTGFFDPDFASEMGKIGGKIGGKKGIKTTNSQRWQCTVTGKVAPPGALTIYQKARGIDPSNRIRIK
jgi:hypothetical protein